eukprot:s490_g7.t1
MGGSRMLETYKCEGIAAAVKLEGRVRVSLEACLVEYGPRRRSSEGKEQERASPWHGTLMGGGMCASIVLWTPVAEQLEEVIKKGFEGRRHGCAHSTRPQ